MRDVAVNRKFRFDYVTVEEYEAGLVLKGSEVKAVRAGKVSIKEAYVREFEGELWAVNMHISGLQRSVFIKCDPKRSRKLLLHRKQINRISGLVQRAGLTVVPISLYFNRAGYLKMRIAVAKGKKKHDRRETIKARQWERDRAREFRCN